MAVAAAIPLGTAVEILSHMSKGSPVVAPIPTRTTPRPTPKPAATPASTPAGQSTPAPAPTPTQPPSAAVTGTFTGSSEPDLFGYLTATVTLQDSKIVGVTINAPMDNPRSAMINQQAVPILKSETLQAQSANIDGISGATATSDAYYNSLVSALQKAGLS